ncbi:MAG: RDD family protein, partial [Planctomycetota bacterium]
VGLSYVFLYYFIFEAICQRTPAKFITGTKVIASVGSKPTVGTIAKRTLIRFVPFEPFSILGEKVYGWHDRWSGTYVIKAKRFEKKSVDHHQIVTCPQPSFVVETPEKSVDILSVSNRKVEVCENCGRTIGKLEQAYVFKKHIVCLQCHEKLKKQI